MSTLKIGQVARLAGVGVETVRFYERQGLVEEPARRASGYRLYEEEVVARLRFIRRAKELGFSLREIGTLLNLRLDPDATRADVKRQVEAKVADIEVRIRDLERMREVLLGLAGACHGTGALDGCPILAALDQAPPGHTEKADDSSDGTARRAASRGRRANRRALPTREGET